MPEVKELVKQLGADQETAYKANKALLEMVTRATAPGSESQRQELAKALAAELTAKADPKKNDPAYPAQVRVKIARLLSFVAGETELMALMGTLRDFDVREMTRFALDFNGSQVATKALIMALDDVGPEFRTGVVGALGRRNDPAAIKTLQELAAGDSDDRVRLAAIQELGNFPDPASDAIIEKAARGPHRVPALVARVRLADSLRRAAKNDDAARIYRAIASGDAEPQHKRAAEIGLKAIA